MFDSANISAKSEDSNDDSAVKMVALWQILR